MVHCSTLRRVDWPYARLLVRLHACRLACFDVVEPVSIRPNRMAVIEFVGVLGVVAGPWNSRRGGGGAGGECCEGLNIISGGLRREEWEKKNHDKCRGPFS
jgi:hypothetical protein